MNTRLLHAAPLTVSIAALATFAAVLLPSVTWAENEIGYIEKFALAADREKVLGNSFPAPRNTTSSTRFTTRTRARQRN